MTPVQFRLRLTRAEHLLIRRLRAKKTQAQMADALGVSTFRYRSWEGGQTGRCLPWLRAQNVHAHELFRVLRRRRGMSQSELAKELRCSRLWVVWMEAGRVDDSLLRSYWASGQ